MRSTGTIIPLAPASTGPSPVALAFDGRHRHVLNQGDRTLQVLMVENDGTLTAVAGGPLSTGGGGGEPSGLAVDPSGRFVYVSNRLTDGVGSSGSTWRLISSENSR